MKILLYTDSLGAGGAQRQLCGLAVLLKNRGYEVDVATYCDIDFYKEYLDSNLVNNVVLESSNGLFSRINSLYKYIKTAKPQVVISYQETPSLISSFVRFLGLKFYLIVSERSTTQKIGLHERVRFILYRWANKIVPNSFTQAKFLSDHDHWMRERIKTVSNYVDLEYFAFEPSLPLDNKVVPQIVIAASIWPVKNTLRFIEAMRILKGRNILYHVKWYGYSASNKDYFDTALNLIKEYRLEEYVELLPKTQNIKEVYKQCHFLCLPSIYEGTPNVIAEAMAIGRPILCSNVCDNPRYVVEGVNGYLFDPYNPEDMADKILKGLSISDHEYSQMCQESRKRAEEMLSMDTFINNYIEIIEGR